MPFATKQGHIVKRQFLHLRCFHEHALSNDRVEAMILLGLRLACVLESSQRVPIFTAAYYIISDTS